MRKSFFLIDYQKYLKRQKISTSTVDNYLVDAINFLHWLGEHLVELNYNINKAQPSTFISFINNRILSEYQKHLIKHESSIATINRRTSGLKKLLEFSFSSGYIVENISKSLKNPSYFAPKKILAEFKRWMTQNNVTDTTVKNYIADIRHYLNFVKK